MNTILAPVTVTHENYRNVAQKTRRPITVSLRQESSVRRIIADVRKRGDAALLEYTRKFDGANLTRRQLRVRPAETRKAIEGVDRHVAEAMRFALKRLGECQKKLLSRVDFSIRMNGFAIHLTAKPLSSVGCYIPGGRAAYPSTVLMTAGLARLAGVQRIVVCTPPNASGAINESILMASSLCDVDEVYKCGGPQAIAALAYGTKTISNVDKIVGPGGLHVALAKRHVSKDVAIDFFAGPTEILIAVDETTDARQAAWDLIAQAEHGEDSFTNLVTVSKISASNVRAEVNRILPSVERRRFVEDSLCRGVTAVCEDWETACNYINELAPEHVELLTEAPRRLVGRITSAGLILLGPYAPAAASDYCMGTDHVLPTGGSAANHSGLSVLDFLKLRWTAEGTPKGLRSLLQPLKALASAEGLPNHYLSAESRFRM